MPVPDARVELQIDGTWTDVTDYVDHPAGIKLARGRSDEGRAVDPGSGSLNLLSPDGRFSNRNPNSPYFGLLPRNTPIRVTTYAGETVLDIPDGVAGRATTPDAAALDITGDIDVRIDLAPAMWAGHLANPIPLMGKYSTTGANRSWRLAILSSGRPVFSWFPDGINLVEFIATNRLCWGPNQRGAIRATLDVNNGLGGWTATFYTAPTIAGPWTQFDQVVTTSGTTSIINSNAALEIGDVPALGWPLLARRIYAAEVRSGIGGSLVANPNFAAQASGTTGFTDSAGRTWSIVNSTITDRRTLVAHSVPTWPATWHLSGHDQRARIQTAGILRRMKQGTKPLASTLRRRIPAYSPLGYWPMEDGETSTTTASSALAGGSPLTVSGFTFAQDDSLDGSSPLPVVASGAVMRGPVRPPTSTILEWMVEMAYWVSAAPGADAEFLALTTSGTVARWRILMRSGVGTLQGYGSDGTLLVNSTVGIGADVFTGWNRLQLRIETVGVDVQWTVTWFNIAGSFGTFTGTVAGAVGIPTSINTRFGTIPDLRIGHVTVFPQGSASFANVPFGEADQGYNGENARDRIARLAGEEAATVSISLVDSDTSRLSERLGPQLPKALLDILQDAADADGGILYEDTTKSALKYRTRTTLENQTPKLIVDYGQLTQPFEPTENDLNLRNVVEVQRDRGGYATVTLEEGPLSTDEVGVYDESVSLNLYQDAQTPLHAGWRLHLASWDEARYPAVRILLHKYPALIPQVMALEIGDRIQITNTPDWMPPGPVDLIVQRIEDELKTLEWTVTLTCSPAGPWTVGVVDDDELGRVDTDGCTLGAGVDADDTSLTLVSNPGPRWVDSATYPSDFPFNILVGGEEMTVTAITGTTLTQTATVTRSVNGIVKAHSSGASVSLADPTYLAL
ncbi:hypothetical protein [Streptomyces sp. NPDC101115]|uniref:hypothetical protein n=1 Tax=Streptomyces sp. NPDC101115 TaxID=3366106 RepID=UPI00380FE5C8